MTSQRHSSRVRDVFNGSAIDRLALGRAQHLQSRDTRPKSVSDDEVDGSISDWSDSDRECCPLSDIDCTSNVDESNDTHLYDIPFEVEQKENKPPVQIAHFNMTRSTATHQLNIPPTPVPIISDSTTSTRISFNNELEKPKQLYVKRAQNTAAPSRKQSQAPLLPGRRIQTKPTALRRPSIYSTTTNSQSSYSSRPAKPMTLSPSRLQIRRETTSTAISHHSHLTKDSRLSPNSSIHSHDKSLCDDLNHQRRNISPNLSQSSVPRVYEIKKLFTDETDYGRLTENASTRAATVRGRQKWGTIVHPPFPLGYQHIAPEQVSQAVERLASPVRCRDRHVAVQSPSKRYLSVEETDALVGMS